MENPQISWHVIEDDEVVPYNEYYAGSCRPGEYIDLVCQVWNNRWGQDDVKDITNGKIVVFFDTLEDNYLLNLCSIKIDNNDFLPVVVNAGRGRLSLERIISGAANMGSSLSTQNFATIAFRFGPAAAGIRNSLKNLFLDLEFDT